MAAVIRRELISPLPSGDRYRREITRGTAIPFACCLGDEDRALGRAAGFAAVAVLLGDFVIFFSLRCVMSAFLRACAFMMSVYNHVARLTFQQYGCWRDSHASRPNHGVFK
jgi:hypothetical protein